MSNPGLKPSIPYWHLYVDEDGVSHQRECPLTAHELRRIGAPDPQWNESPAAQWIVVLSARWFIESLDCARIERRAGEFFFGEDQGCIQTDGKKGHHSGIIGRT